MGKAVGILLSGFLAAAGATGVWAAVGDQETKASKAAAPERGAAGLKRFDADQDQAITLDEFLKRRVEAFTKRDKNGDGVLDAVELAQAPLGFRQQRQEQRMVRLLGRLDANADGKLTKQEFETTTASRPEVEPPRRGRNGARQELVFSFYDRNSDGVIEKTEFDAARAEEIDYAKRKRLHALDRDGDGRVTLEEYTADARFRFLRLDLDRDGRITAADLPPVERQRWSQR